MKKAILLIFLPLWIVSCQKSASDPCEGPDPDCSGVRCLAHFDYFEFRLLDKLTGEDLVYSANPKFSVDDIKLFADAAKSTLLTLTADAEKKSFSTGDARSGMYLEIGGTDVYNLTASFMVNDCCSNRVKALSIDNEPVCTCCAPVISIWI